MIGILPVTLGILDPYHLLMGQEFTCYSFLIKWLYFDWMGMRIKGLNRKDVVDCYLTDLKLKIN